MRMPLLDEPEVMIATRRTHPAARLTILSTSDTDTDVARVIKAGARDYLLVIEDSNRLIGGGLQVGEATVKTHLRSIFDKLDLISRTKAVSIARRRRLVIR